jgi:UDP-2,3-diacylglucosamine hydrolase
MGERLGVIAGSGPFALQALSLAKAQGYACVVAGVRGEAAPELQAAADAFAWFRPSELDELVAFFEGHGVRQVVLVGKVDPIVLARRDQGDPALAALLDRLPDATPTSVLLSLIGLLGSRGLAVRDPGFLIARFFRPAGRLGRIDPSPEAAADIAFGRPMARGLADLDIGQTVVVKGRTVVAVEGLDGTDETIRRAGRLAGPGCVVIKTSRTRQDQRVDVPGVGLETVRACLQAGAAALCIEAGKVAFFQLEESAALSDEGGLALIAQ